MKSNALLPFFEVMTPSEFLSLVQSDRGKILKSYFIPPRIGSNEFGSFYIKRLYASQSNTRPKPKNRS